jgi:hypothetical protein
MKKILMLLLLLPAVAFCNEIDPDEPMYAQTKIVCVNGVQLFSALQNFGEIPMVSMVSYRATEVGKKRDTSTFETRLFANPSTGTWTLVERHDVDLYCVSALGEQLKPIQNKD